MIGVIARKEITDLWRDSRFRWGGAIVLLLLALALAMGGAHYRTSRTEREQADQITRAQWLAQGAKHPHAAAHYGLYAFKPASPLSVIDPGVEAYLGVTVWLEAHKQNDFEYAAACDATPVQRFGELTAAAVLQGLLPLLIILLAAPALVGEREQGTLRQILSLGVRPGELALGKMLGLAGALALLVLPAVALGVATLALTAPGEGLRAGWARPALMGAAYLLYALIMLGLSLVVSAKAPSSRVALLVLLAFWMATTLLIPRIASDAARRLVPTPTAFEFSTAVEAAMAQFGDGHLPDASFDALVLKRYGVQRPEDLPVSLDGLRLQQGEENGYRVYDRVYGEVWDLFERQDRVHRTAALFSPLLAVRALSAGLAGTDFAQHRTFAEAAERHRRLLIGLVNDDITRHAKTGDRGYQADRALWERVPPFEYRPPSVRWVIERQAWSLVWLALWAIAATLAAWRAAVTMRIE